MVSKATKKSPLSLVLPGLLAIGFLVVVANVLFNIPNLLLQLNTKVQTPTTYPFDSFDKILKKHVKQGLVDYASLKDAGSIDAACLELQAISPAKLPSEKAKLAFWVNAHNLLTMKVILDRYPIKLVTSVGQDTGTRQFLIGGNFYSIKQIKKDVLQPLYETADWRGIFIVCDGSLGGPEIADHVYQDPGLDQELATACKRFVASPAHVQADPQTATLSISPFYRWNREFIELKYPSPFDLVADYLPTKTLIDVGKINRNYGLEYDWRLNDKKLLDELKKEMQEKK
ncbi:MAG: DUF547 domain-containing protein [Candidatus Obscuribacterales bacterium]|jgi:hypothetical protein|nr:DUF547 domain-containing protein [Candidatus Obscuribacterales bacterium]